MSETTSPDWYNETGELTSGRRLFFEEPDETVGVILAAGEGQRMGEISALYPKPVLPVCNHPLVCSHMHLFQQLGIARVIVVVGHQKQKVIDVATDYCPHGMSLTFIEQKERLGIAHALQQTREVTAGANLVVVLGDTYFIVDDIKAGLDRLKSGFVDGVGCVLSVRKVQDPEMIRRECTVRFDSEGCLEEILEKPVQPFNDLKPCGIYFFSPAIFDAIEYTNPSALRGEVEITDSIQSLVDLGYTVVSAPTVHWDRNINYPGDLLISNLVELRRRGLDNLVGDGFSSHEETRLKESVVGHNVTIHSPARILRSLILDNTELDEHGEFRDCVIGYRFAIADCLRWEWADTPEWFAP